MKANSLMMGSGLIALGLSLGLSISQHRQLGRLERQMTEVLSATEAWRQASLAAHSSAPGTEAPPSLTGLPPRNSEPASVTGPNPIRDGRRHSNNSSSSVPANVTLLGGRPPPGRAALTAKTFPTVSDGARRTSFFETDCFTPEQCAWKESR